jgi:hypothetical protein
MTLYSSVGAGFTLNQSIGRRLNDNQLAKVGVSHQEIWIAFFVYISICSISGDEGVSTSCFCVHHPKISKPESSITQREFFIFFSMYQIKPPASTQVVYIYLARDCKSYLLKISIAIVIYISSFILTLKEIENNLNSTKDTK